MYLLKKENKKEEEEEQRKKDGKENEKRWLNLFGNSRVTKHRIKHFKLTKIISINFNKYRKLWDVILIIIIANKKIVYKLRTSLLFLLSFVLTFCVN